MSSGEKIIHQLCSCIQRDPSLFFEELMKQLFNVNKDFYENLETIVLHILNNKVKLEMNDNSFTIFEIEFKYVETPKKILKYIHKLISLQVEKNKISDIHNMFQQKVTDQYTIIYSNCVYDYLISERLPKVWILKEFLYYISCHSTHKAQIYNLIEYIQKIPVSGEENVYLNETVKYIKHKHNLK